MDPITQQQVLAAAGAGGADPLYQDDVFTTHLWDGHPTGSTQSIDCGIDLTEGGLVWAKGRDSSDNHYWVDSVRGKTGTYYDNIASDWTAAEVTNQTYGVTSFNNNGFTVSGSHARLNDGSKTYASWVFRKAEGFFDIVEYSGNSTNGHQIPHNLGSAPGCIMIKKLTAGSDWYVYHRELGHAGALRLNDAGSEVTGVWNSTNPTSTHFTLSSHTEVNQSGHQYIAYIFAHQQNNFGADGNQDIIRCGAFYTDSSSRANVAIGWEPEFFLIKRVNGTDDWKILDASRGHTAGSYDYRLYANRSNTEGAVNGYGYPNTSGVALLSSPVSDNSQIYSSSTYVYIAIRRLPKPPESGTDVYMASQANQSVDFNVGFRPDLAWTKNTTGGNFFAGTRLTGNKFILLDSANTEGNASWAWNNPTGTFKSTETSFPISYLFKRAPGFLDIVAYNGDYVNGRAIDHNLGVVPEMIITYGRNFGGGAGFTIVPSLSTNEMVKITSTASRVSSFYGTSSSTQPTATHYYVSSNNDINETGRTYVSYLFASLDGVSKVGTYNGTGNAINVDCGFTNGARFVLIKRWNATGGWFLFDSTRGITSNNDPYFEVQNTNQSITSQDLLTPLSTGFTVNGSITGELNSSSGTYIYLAIA